MLACSSGAATPYGHIAPPFDSLLNHVIAARDRGEYRQVVSLVDEALKKQPPVNAKSAFYSERCYAMQRLANNKQAIADCSEAIRLVPATKSARAYRAFSYSSLGQSENAVADLTVALRLGYSYRADIYFRRAEAYQDLGKKKKARLDYENVLRAQMDGGFDYFLRAKANSRLGNYKAAANDFAAAKKRTAPDASQLNDSAWFEATCPDARFRDGMMAVRDAIQALKSNPSNSNMLDTLGCAYAELGDFQRAVSYVEQALRAATASDHQTDALRAHLRLFREKRPFRESPEF